MREAHWARLVKCLTPAQCQALDVAQPFVEKVKRHAYRVTDADVERLLAAGLSEEEIFELTLSTALEAAQARLDAGLAALR